MQPAPAGFDFADMLRQAIHARAALLLRREGDDAERLFEPYILYRSRMGSLRLAGQELVQGVTGARREPRVIDVATILALRLSDRRFEPDPRFDATDPRYQFGILCHV
ncbi:MAG: hypothetical protein KIT20_02415 [Alphaproteobacteria bacterium]|nr:hypothetical protein [Alphaproteobacteria bacterium]